MIKISRAIALKILRDRMLPRRLVGKVTIVMKESEALAWLAALRDGKQKQARGVLYRSSDAASEHYPVGFCCLGLEQAVNFGGKCEVDIHGRFRDIPSYDYLKLTNKAYFSMAGLYSRSPAVYAELQECSIGITQLNDGGTSFSKIADLLENHMAVY